MGSRPACQGSAGPRSATAAPVGWGRRTSTASALLAAWPGEEGTAGLSSAEDSHAQGQPRWALPPFPPSTVT